MMNHTEFNSCLNRLGLVIIDYLNGMWGVRRAGIANTLFLFDPETETEDYRGHIYFKIINAPLYTEEQIQGASELIHSFLMTPLSSRGITR